MLFGEHAEVLEQVAAARLGRGVEEGLDRRDEVGVMLQGGRILQLVNAPLVELVRLEPGDGGQLVLEFEPYGLRLGAYSQIPPASRVSVIPALIHRAVTPASALSVSCRSGRKRPGCPLYIHRTGNRSIG